MKKVIITSLLVFCTILGRAQWQKTSSPNSGGVNCFINNGSYLFAGTDSAGTFLSTDNGDNWAVAASGLTNKSVKSITANSNYIFAGTYGNGVYLSSDQGSNWTPVSKGLTNLDINVLITTGTYVLAGTNSGVFISSDNGSNWSAINKGLSTVFVVSIATNGTQIFAGTNGGGIFLSTDTGKSWNAVNNGLNSDSVNALTINGSYIYAGTNSNGVYMSSNNGNSWQAVNSGLTNNHIWALVTNGSHIFAATGGGGKHNGTGGGTGGGKGKGGVFIIKNTGTTWTPVNTGLPQTDVRSLYIVGSTIFAGTEDSNVWKRPLSELTSGIQGLSTNNPGLMIYPNPANTLINIEFNTTSREELVIYNVIGEIVYRNIWLPFQTDFHKVDISTWEKGVYFMKIGSNTEKIIKD